MDASLVPGVVGGDIEFAPAAPPPRKLPTVSRPVQSTQSVASVQRPRRELRGPGLVPGTVQNYPASAPPVRYEPQYAPTPRYTQPQQMQQSPANTTGMRIGAMGFSLASGLFPIPFNPLFFPIQMVAFIIIIIILLVKGWSFWTSALIAWIVPAIFAAVVHYMIIGGIMSMYGRGECEKM